MSSWGLHVQPSLHNAFRTHPYSGHRLARTWFDIAPLSALLFYLLASSLSISAPISPSVIPHLSPSLPDTVITSGQFFPPGSLLPGDKQ